MNNNYSFTEQQKIAISLIRNDLRFIYTAFRNQEQLQSNYITFSMPLLGTIVDGVEDWIKSFNNSSKRKLDLPTFTNEEQEYYEEMRHAIKLWDNSYEAVYQKLQTIYQASDDYFSNLCKPIAKKMHLYDIFGVDLVDDEFCGNTILCAYFTPQYQFGNCDGEIIKKRSEIMGAYVALFGATSEYAVNTNLQFRYKDYGGFVKSPVCNEFSDKFVLFSLLCQTQFVINCVEKYVAEECTTKFRFLYLQYYYLSKILPEINQKLHANFAIDGTLVSSPFRNAMAHYKIGVALRNDEIVNSDPFFGLTQKFLQCDYYSAKQFVLNNLSSLVYQIKKYLQIDKG